MAGRPKGTTKTNARRVKITIPLTVEEKELVELAALVMFEKEPGYADAAATASVWRRAIVETAAMIVETYRGFQEDAPDRWKNIVGLDGLLMVDKPQYEGYLDRMMKVTKLSRAETINQLIKDVKAKHDQESSKTPGEQ